MHQAMSLRRYHPLLLALLFLAVVLGAVFFINGDMPALLNPQPGQSAAYFALAIVLFSAGMLTVLYCLLRAEILNPLRQLREQILRINPPEDSVAMTNGEEINGLILAIHSLLSRLQRDEYRYRTFADASPDVVFITDRAGRLVFINANGGRLFLAPAETLTGKTEAELFPPHIVELRRRKRRELLETGQPALPEDCEHLIGSSHVWMSQRLIPIRDQRGEVSAVMYIFQDITERKQLEQKLEASEKALRLAGQAKDQFLASVSHELRTPLNAIIGFSDFLLEDARLNPEQKRDVERISVNAQNLLRLIDDLLDLTQIEAGKIRLMQETTNLAALCGRVVDNFQRQARKKSLRIVNLIRSPLPAASVDPRRITEVLDNLMSNAVKYSQEGGTITLAAARKEDALEISVADTGIGIPPEYRDKIFDRFVRAPNAPVAAAAGTGLGLAICRQLVGLHGGQIRVASEEGKGSVFTFSLPVGEERKSDGRQSTVDGPQSSDDGK